MELAFGKNTDQRSQKRPKTEKKEAKQHRTGKTNETEPKIEKGHALIQAAILTKDQNKFSNFQSWINVRPLL